MSFPADVKYTEHDEWVHVDGDVVTIGISAFAQDALGELVHIEMPEVGKTVSAGDALCEVESVKAVAEVFSPVSGEVIEVNESLDGSEDVVNSDPYGAGWLVRVRFTDPTGLEDLMDAEAYAQKVAEA